MGPDYSSLFLRNCSLNFLNALEVILGHDVFLVLHHINQVGIILKEFILSNFYLDTVWHVIQEQFESVKLI